MHKVQHRFREHPMTAPPNKSLHLVRHAAFDAYVARLKPDSRTSLGELWEAFKAGWDAREAVMQASVLEAPH